MATPMVAVLEVLQDALDLLTTPASGECVLSPEPCRVVLSPGATVAWDTCGEGSCTGKDGQLWAALLSASVAGDARGECRRITWQAQIGVVRCAAKAKGTSKVPPADAIEADAWQQALDADTIMRALTCCESRPDSLRDVALVAWQSLGPNGGCVGGMWTVRGVLDECC